MIRKLFPLRCSPTNSTQPGASGINTEMFEQFEAHLRDELLLLKETLDDDLVLTYIEVLCGPWGRAKTAQDAALYAALDAVYSAVHVALEALGRPSELCEVVVIPYPRDDAERKRELDQFLADLRAHAPCVDPKAALITSLAYGMAQYRALHMRLAKDCRFSEEIDT